MKRSFPTATIEDYFASSQARRPIPVDSASASSKQPPVIVRVASEKTIKKIVILSLSNGAKYDDSRFDTILDDVKAAIPAIFAGRMDEVNFSRLFGSVEFFCRLQNPKFLYDLLLPELKSGIATFSAKITI
jgi:hypothetical protein